MKIILIITTSFLIFISNANGDDHTKLIGKKLRDVKPDFKIISAMVVQNPKTLEYTKYGIDVVKAETKETLILLSRNDSADCEKPNYEIIDVLGAPTPQKGYYFQIIDCKKNNIQRGDLVVIVKHEDKEFLDNIFKVWKIDLETKRIIEIPKKGIVCENKGWGL